MIGRLFAAVIALLLVIVSLLSDGLKCGGTAGPRYSGGRDQPQARAEEKFRRLKPKKTLPSFEEFCRGSKFAIQPQQEFAAEYMSPGAKSPAELLVFHKIGAGKTCLSIQVAERWTKKGRPLVIMPASLIPGFRNELRGLCGGERYMRASEREAIAQMKPATPEYNELIKLSDARIDLAYHVTSYNKFMADMEGGKKIDAPIIIVDEVQNISGQGAFYRAINDWIEQHMGASVVLMSGTPIFDSPREIYALAKLLRIRPANKEPLVITPENIGELFAGKVSYYAGAPDFTFPTTTVKIKKCKMSALQRRWYTSQVEAEMSKMGDIKMREVSNDFYIKSRQRSNIVFPNGLTGEEGLDRLTPALIRDSLQTYSCKYDALIKKLKRGKLSFVYTGFTGCGGILSLVKCLQVFGWKDYAVDGPGRHRYAIWSGEQTGREKDAIRATFNSSANDDASQIQVVIGSPSIKEGVTLTRVRHVHVLEAYWNFSRLEQIYGRAVRYCSHKTLPADERNVMIYLYCAWTEDSREVTPMTSIDLYMLSMAEKKRAEAEPYVRALIDVAVDRYVHYPRG